MRNLKGETFEVGDDEVTITEVGEYEPPFDPSEGIGTGYVTVTCSDGNDYDIMDNGDVYPADGAGAKRVAQVGELWDGCEDCDD
mgnify:CR=1 FL=1